MALTNPSGAIVYWFNGLPAEGVVLDANPGGNCLYWGNGLPSEWVDPTGGAPPATSIKDLIENTGMLATPR